MLSTKEIEESEVGHLDFSKLLSIAEKGMPVLPVVIQDASNLEVLLIAYVNEEALRLSIHEKRAVLYSTSRSEIWRKGETSGDILHLKEIRVNCEQNSLLFLVSKAGKGSCHTKNAAGEHRSNCYYRTLVSLQQLQLVPGQA